MKASVLSRLEHLTKFPKLNVKPIEIYQHQQQYFSREWHYRHFWKSVSVMIWLPQSEAVGTKNKFTSKTNVRELLSSFKTVIANGFCSEEAPKLKAVELFAYKNSWYEEKQLQRK